MVSGSAIIWTTVVISRENVKNLKESLAEFKIDIHLAIDKEKRHAMAMAQQRMGTIEKDVDEIFPRLRKTESDSQKNCFALTEVMKNCIKHKKVEG